MSNIPKKLAEKGWPENTAWLCERAGFKCEYCGLDFFASVANFKSIQIDHIVPLSKGGKDTNDNKAISCRTCNFDLKSRWNPAKGCDSKDRDKLIEAARNYIKEKEKNYLDEIALIKSIVNS